MLHYLVILCGVSCVTFCLFNGYLVYNTNYAMKFSLSIFLFSLLQLAFFHTEQRDGASASLLQGPLGNRQAVGGERR